MTRVRVGPAASYACLALAGACFLLPLYVVVGTALKPDDEIMTGTLLAPPVRPDLTALRAAWSSVCLATGCDGLRESFFNSVRIATPAACLSVLLGAINGYALTKARLPRADLLFVLMLAANVIPHQLVLLPVAIMLRAAHLFGTVEGLILVHIAYGMPYMTLLFRNFYRGIPDEIIAAARMEGAGFWSIFRHVVLPMSLPMLAVAFMLQFTAIWNDYLFGLVFGGRAAPVTVVLNNLIDGGLGGRDYNVNMAGVLITALPPLLLYGFAGRWFLRGLADAGAR